MKRIASALVLVIGLTACAAGQPTPPAAPAPVERTGILGNVDRANEVADQVNDREAELEQMVADLGG